jgi:hypothetical protein
MSERDELPEHVTLDDLSLSTISNEGRSITKKRQKQKQKPTVPLTVPKKNKKAAVPDSWEELSD